MTLEHDEMAEIEDAQNGKYLEFLIDTEAYGIPIRYVTEIIGMQAVNSLPEAPSYVKGIINLRGKIIPVIDMHCRLNKREMQYTDRTCIVVVETDRLTIGLIVDSVTEVLAIDEKDFAPPPKIKTADSNGYLSGIEKVNAQVRLLLDCDRLFNDEETKIVKGLN